MVMGIVAKILFRNSLRRFWCSLHVLIKLVINLSEMPASCPLAIDHINFLALVIVMNDVIFCCATCFSTCTHGTLTGGLP